MSDIQVGDVWKTEDGFSKTVTAVGRDNVLTTCGPTESRVTFKDMGNYTLTFRNGKPVKPERVFEEGYYWVGSRESGPRYPIEYRDGGWLIIGSGRTFVTAEFHHIGEKLEEPWG